MRLVVWKCKNGSKLRCVSNTTPYRLKTVNLSFDQILVAKVEFLTFVQTLSCQWIFPVDISVTIRIIYTILRLDLLLKSFFFVGHPSRLHPTSLWKQRRAAAKWSAPGETRSCESNQSDTQKMPSTPGSFLKKNGLKIKGPLIQWFRPYFLQWSSRWVSITWVGSIFFFQLIPPKNR